MMWRTRFEVPLMTYPAWKPGPHPPAERRWLSIETNEAMLPNQHDLVRLFDGDAQGVLDMSARVALVTVCPAHPGPGIVLQAMRHPGRLADAGAGSSTSCAPR